MDGIRRDEVTLPPNIKSPAGRPKKRRMRRRVQREGMLVLQETDGSDTSDAEASSEGLIELDRPYFHENTRKAIWIPKEMNGFVFDTTLVIRQ